MSTNDWRCPYCNSFNDVYIERSGNDLICFCKNCNSNYVIWNYNKNKKNEKEDIKNVIKKR